MSTTEKLQNILNSKNAIRDKFNLGDIPFSQYAENINAGGDAPTASTEFYEVTNVSTSAEPTVIYDTWMALWVFNAEKEYNGLWYLVSGEGTSRVWQHEKNEKYVIKNVGGAWGIYEVDTLRVPLNGSAYPYLHKGENDAPNCMRVVFYPYWDVVSFSDFKTEDVTPGGTFGSTYFPHLVYDLNSPCGYYWQARTSGSGSVWYVNIYFRLYNGKWYFSANDNHLVYTDAEMPFQKDGSTVQWRSSASNVTGTTTGSGILPGVWDFEPYVIKSTDSNSALDKFVPGIYYPTENNTWKNLRGEWLKIGTYTVEAPYIGWVYGTDPDTGETYKYKDLITSGSYEITNSMLASFTFGRISPYSSDNEATTSATVEQYEWNTPSTEWTSYDPETETSTTTTYPDVTISSVRGIALKMHRGAYCPLIKARKLRMFFDTETVDLSSDDGEVFRGGQYVLSYGKYSYLDTFNYTKRTTDWNITFDYAYNPEGHEALVGQFQEALTPFAPNMFGFEIESNNYSALRGLQVADNEKPATVCMLEAMCELRDYVIVERSGLSNVDGIYRRQTGTEYYVRQKMQLSDSSMYLVKRNEVWELSGTLNSSTVLKQSAGGYDLPSAYAPYVTASASELSDRTTSAVVRYAIPGEVPGAMDNSWSGRKAILQDDGNYGFDAKVSDFAMVEGGFNPAVGNIYSKDFKIQIEQLYGSGRGKFFLCGYVNRTYFSAEEIVVSGMPDNAFVGATYMDYETWETKELPADVAARNPNGTYVLQNPAAESYEQYWKAENGCIIKRHPYGSGYVIYPGEYNDLSKYIECYGSGMEESGMTAPAPDDYTTYLWSYYDGNNTVELGNASVAIPKPAPIEQYWEGYRLYQDKYGKWLYDAEKTRLTYRDFMPVAGRVYDAGCSMEITNIDFATEALWACPHGMTSNENDEWLVSIINNKVYNNQEPYYAFDGSNIDEWKATAFKGDSASNQWFLQWQNKQRPVLLKVLYGMPGGGDWGWRWDDFNWQIYGSNNGEDWDLLFSGKWESDGAWEGTSDYLPKRKITITKDAGLYFYYRLGATSGETNQAHHIEAYSQIPREVPK